MTCEFASDEEPSPIDAYSSWFTSLEDALHYAHNEYSEYGVRLSKEIEDQQTYELINKATKHDHVEKCKDDLHEVERLKAEVRETSLSKFAAVERHGNVLWQPREPMVYKIMRPR